MNTKMKGKKDKKLIRSISIYSKLNSISHIDHSLPIAKQLCGKNTADGVRKRHYRFFKSKNPRK